MAYCARDPEGQKLQANGWRWRSRRYYTERQQFLMRYFIWEAIDDSSVLIKQFYCRKCRNKNMNVFRVTSSSYSLDTDCVVLINCGKHNLQCFVSCSHSNTTLEFHSSTIHVFGSCLLLRWHNVELSLCTQ